MGFAEKQKVVMPKTAQEMSDDAIATYREEERTIKDSIANNQETLDGIKADIKTHEASLAVLENKIQDAQKKLNDINLSFDCTLKQLHDESDAYLKDCKDAMDVQTQNLNNIAEANRKESARLAQQKADQDAGQVSLDAGLNQLKLDRESWNKIADEQLSNLKKKENEINLAVKSNQEILDKIVLARQQADDALAALEDRKASNADIDKKLSDNAALVQQIADGQVALDARASELDAKEKNLIISAESQDNLKNQIQLRKDNLDLREQDLNQREKVCADKEAQLNKKGE